ncbi:hypothetical protein [Streptomyces sp. BPTC-684]|uniref:hypothetical protein n=1 Tax=Streptomyces sp. BPTC-684 TaxID=3043734 RepID=UPI0024B266FB|nr:hypothetical protein [Streptomyces sp. BPTC-684]WHM40815.1 hypothetical protein QIY60_30680 [Streptomyces sp. BPTC-684]
MDLDGPGRDVQWNASLRLGSQAESGAVGSREGFVKKGGGTLKNRVRLFVRTTPGLGFTPQYANCAEVPDDEAGPGTAFKYTRTSVCSFEGEFTPGVAYETDVPLDVVRLANASSAERSALTGAEGGRAVPGPGTKKLGLRVRTRGDVVGQSSATQRNLYEQTAPADLSVTGNAKKAKVGQTLTLTAGLRNDGPAELYDGDNADGIAFVSVKLPEGVRVVKATQACKRVEEGALYRCSSGDRMPVHRAQTFPFEVKVDKAVEDSVGSVTLLGIGSLGDPAKYDVDSDDHTARTALNTTATGTTTSGTTSGSGSGGASGGSGGSTSGGASGGSGTTGSAASSGTNGASGGHPASTGTSAAALGSGAVLLLGAGAATGIAVRRRRGTGVEPTGPSRRPGPAPRRGYTVTILDAGGAPDAMPPGAPLRAAPQRAQPRRHRPGLS